MSSEDDRAHCSPDVEGTLCVSCGLCCSGAIFDYVPLDSGDNPALIREELDTPQKRERGEHFTLPCQCLDGTRCTIYGSHPTVCRNYRCALLKRHQAGEVTTAQAQSIIEGAKQLHAAARQSNAATMPALREAMRSAGSSETARPEALAARLHYVALQRYIDTHFREASQRHVRSMRGTTDPD